ncbi:hypothetical protein K435DRAFT_783986 [Dendrothele bispora CBS 962.96]|uniref:Uncharacterized protein n=1 Tax=Dendrothele bispora (strain CBS 962.96) TaxID=1314807 RepID=A0A4S8L641_DENBC|nr:hypothetical protein K435DRAFT_783986 [Dendrothele bispora CBS 962.96]
MRWTPIFLTALVFGIAFPCFGREDRHMTVNEVPSSLARRHLERYEISDYLTILLGDIPFT